MKYWLALPLFAILHGCESSEKPEPESKESFISVRSLIEGQVKHVDTSLYPIIKVTIHESGLSDTVPIPRESFRTEARTFLDIPDLADPKVAYRYRKDPVQYDETMDRVIITYRPIELEKEEIKKQEMLVTPSPATGDKVTTILITREVESRDSLLNQDMIWVMDKSFQIKETSQKVGEPEKITIYRVIWNPDE